MKAFRPLVVLLIVTFAATIIASTASAAPIPRQVLVGKTSICYNFHPELSTQQPGTVELKIHRDNPSPGLQELRVGVHINKGGLESSTSYTVYVAKLHYDETTGSCDGVAYQPAGEFTTNTDGGGHGEGAVRISTGTYSEQVFVSKTSSAFPPFPAYVTAPVTVTVP